MKSLIGRDDISTSGYLSLSHCLFPSGVTIPPNLREGSDTFNATAFSISVMSWGDILLF